MSQSTNQTVKFGLGQISNEAPEWATWIFRGYFILSKAVLGWLAATHLIPQAALYEVITLITFLLDPLFYGVSKLFGIQPEDPQPSLPLVADKQVQDDGSTKIINPVIVNPSPAITEGGVPTTTTIISSDIPIANLVSPTEAPVIKPGSDFANPNPSGE